MAESSVFLDSVYRLIFSIMLAEENPSSSVKTLHFNGYIHSFYFLICRLILN